MDAESARISATDEASTQLRHTVEQLAVEMKDERGKLETVAGRQDRLTETTDRLQTGVGDVQTDVTALREALRQTGEETKQLSDRVDQLDTAHSDNVRSVSKLRTQLDFLQTQVG